MGSEMCIRDSTCSDDDIKEYIFSICEIRGNKNSRYLWRDFEKEPFWASFLPDVCGVVFVVDNQL